MKVFITGGTGLVGTRLTRKLLERGDTPYVLTRSPDKAKESFGEGAQVVEGDPNQAGTWMDRVQECDAVINLAGENLFGKRWNDKVKEQIRESRVRTTANVVEALAKNPTNAEGKAKIVVSASAIGIYGPHDDEQLTEESPPANDYLGQVCLDWENEALKAESHGIRVAIVRVGIVLDKEGGALAKLWTPFKFGVGGKVGSGKQWMSWIHHEDLIGLFLLGLDNENAKGPINGTAPNPVTNKEFTKALGRAMHRPTIFPVPKFGLRLMLGEVADVVINGQRVLPTRAQELGYTFKYPEVDEALRAIVQA